MMTIVRVGVDEKETTCYHTHKDFLWEWTETRWCVLMVFLYEPMGDTSYAFVHRNVDQTVD